jgi:phosphatidylglycerophosphate synthase
VSSPSAPCARSGAGKGVKLPVTLLAKWKTTLQLVAIGAELILASWGAFGLSA